jgi:hypothetical protein
MEREPTSSTSHPPVEYATPDSGHAPTHPAAATSVFLGICASTYAALACAAVVLSRRGGGPGGESLLMVVVAVCFLVLPLFGLPLALRFGHGAMRTWGLILNSVPLVAVSAAYLALSLR